MSSYLDKLQHPKWQRKRLEIMQRDDFQCQSCHSEEKMLNVHHRRYISDQEPWEYADDDLITLCSDCHELVHAITDAYKSEKFITKQEFLEKVLGKNTEIIKRGPFAIFSDPNKNEHCIVFHMPTGFWHGFSMSLKQAIYMFDNNPNSKQELLVLILQGASANFPTDE